MAAQAIELHIEGLIEAGQSVPDHGRSMCIRETRITGAGCGLVKIDSTRLRPHAKRVNVTIPRCVLDAVDRAARAEDETRSSLLAKAATAYLKAGRPPASRRRKPGWRGQAALPCRAVSGRRQGN